MHDPDKPFLELQDLDKRFGDHAVLTAISLTVERGEMLALLGRSGSGKTTLLRLLAGFESPDGGRILLEGTPIDPLPPARRRFGMVFQHYALFPHLTVAENIAFGLESNGTERAEIQRRVAQMLELVALSGFEHRRIGEISGGQQQRVALARALAPEPQLLLLDEPLSNLDPTLRERTRRELKRTLKRIGITSILVTHEQEEAFELGDRIAVLDAGRLEQVGTAQELYRAPRSLFVATFVGRGTVLGGEVAAVVPGEGGEARVEVALAAPLAGRWPAKTTEVGLVEGEPVTMVARPEALRLTTPGAPGALPGRVTSRRYTGPGTYLTVAVEGGITLEVLTTEDDPREGEAVALRPDGLAPRVFRGGGGR
jgi:ABC-type Fe3+/spermidine/putrescine transport system ATPase subunit